jgi:uncharacterized BrkB/YihY/UPF0761 family membrane protein
MPIQNKYPDQEYFSRRLSAHSVIGGVLVIYASMSVLMALAGGLGLWEFDLHQISDLGTGFWAWALAAWILSVYAGGFLASTVSRSVDRRDGVIQGVVTWAAACVFGCLFLVYFTQAAEHVMSRGMLWGAFLGDSLALGGAILGGLAGSKSEVKSTLSTISSVNKGAGIHTIQSPAVGVR